MNHLAHYLLAPSSDAARMGTLLGDFARGPDLSAWPVEVESAIRLHRRVDSVTDTHPVVAEVKALAPPHLRRYAGILMDVFFDHVLIAQWARWSDAPMEDLCHSVYASLERTAPGMPVAAQGLAVRMGRYDILRNCTTRAGVAHVLERIASRLSRPVALAEGIAMLDAHHARVEAAFEQFFPELKATAAHWPPAFAT
ncbi:MAG TPA: ACP phosphodiesterase [Burkholderiales bacterium]|jgi:acyl carrier protein phosphodiesterase